MKKRTIAIILFVIICPLFLFVYKANNKTVQITRWDYEQKQSEELLSKSINSKLVGELSAKDVALIIANEIYPGAIIISDEEITSILDNPPDIIYDLRRPVRKRDDLALDIEDVMNYFAYINDSVVFYITKHNDWHYLELIDQNSDQIKFYDSYLIFIAERTGDTRWNAHTPMGRDHLIVVDYGSVEEANLIRELLNNETEDLLTPESRVSLSPMSLVNNSSRFGFFYNAGGSRISPENENMIYTFYRVLESGLDFSKVK